MSLFGSSGRNDERTPVGARERSEPVSAAAGVPEAGSRSRTGVRETPAGGNEVAILGQSILFKGDLSGDEDIEIEGRVEGQIKLPNHQLTVGAHGRVTAKVEAKNVIVIGRVAGDVIASERIEIQATGVVDGDIHAPRLLIQEGAVVNGNIEMGDAQTKAATTSPAPAEPARKTG